MNTNQKYCPSLNSYYERCFSALEKNSWLKLTRAFKVKAVGLHFNWFRML